MQSFKRIGAVVLGLSLPLLAAAQGGLTNVVNVVTTIKTILNAVILVMFALLIIYFIWGVIQYVSAGGDEEKLKTGKQHMLWGIIGIAIVGAIFGITNWLYGVFGVNTAGNYAIPSF